MKWLCLSSLVLALAGCSTPAFDVIQMGDGVLRAPTYGEAAEYCESKGTASQPVGKAKGDMGILFRCG